jgi:tetratricopeptide (TPR) repeat protein
VVESESEGFRIDAERALRMADDDFDARFAELDGVLMTGGFEQARGALEACTELHDRFYGDEDRRFLLEERVRSGWSSVPTDVRIDLLGRLAESAIGHGDRSKALGLVDEAQALIDGAHWTMQHRLPLVARNAALRFRAGQEDRARGQVDAALAAFEADPEAIVNMFRGEALRPLAEAYHAMGLTPMAHAVYTRVLEEAVVNRNSRPRAIDLSETCLSLALHAIEPTDALAARLREIAGALGDPW